jgi:leucyl aminopeptidase
MKSIRVSIPGILLISFHAFASSEPRLLEVGPNERIWATDEDQSRLSALGHEKGACPGFIDVTNHPGEPRPGTKIQSSIQFNLDPQFSTETSRVLNFLSRGRFESNIRYLQGYHNRYYSTDNGVRSAAWIKGQFEVSSQHREDVQVRFFQHQGWPQPSVIAKIQGEDPLLANEVIVVGAHEDSHNTTVKKSKRAKARAPGADDNGSGVSAVLEVFKAFIDSGIRPKRTLMFMTYAAEEVGLRGSMDIAAEFDLKNTQVAAVLNLDMILYNGPAHVMGVTTSNTDPALTDFVKKLIDRYVGAPWKTRSCGYACSDHASWDRNGYRASFLFETVDDISPWWHHPNDLLNASTDIDWGMNFVKTGAAFVVELGLAPGLF